jgi:hypothetical protein
MLDPSQRLEQPQNLKKTDLYSWKKQARSAEDDSDLSSVESDFVPVALCKSSSSLPKPNIISFTVLLSFK